MLVQYNIIQYLIYFLKKQWEWEEIAIIEIGIEKSELSCLAWLASTFCCSFSQHIAAEQV